MPDSYYSYGVSKPLKGTGPAYITSAVYGRIPIDETFDEITAALTRRSNAANTATTDIEPLLSKIPEDQSTQAIVTVVEEDDEARWQNLFAASHEMLIQMANEAEEDYIRGRTWSIDKAD